MIIKKQTKEKHLQQLQENKAGWQAHIGQGIKFFGIGGILVPRIPNQRDLYFTWKQLQVH